MARARGKLSEEKIDTEIAACVASKTRREMTDGVNGLSIAITANGCATWWVRYRNASGTQRRDKIGQYGPHASGTVVSLPAARTKAKKISAEADAGKDPAAEKAALRRAGASPDSRITVRDFGEAWTSGKLLERYGEVHGLKEKASADDDRMRLEAHVYPFIGKRPIVEVTEEEIEQTMKRAAAAAKKKRDGVALRAATRFQIYQAMRRLFQLAIRPARLRTDNPVSPGVRPKAEGDKLFGFLYPTEMQRLVECPTIPPGRRVLYALATYTGLRLGSLLDMKWSDVDLTHGTVRVLNSKTDLSQIFAQRDPTIPGLGSLLTMLERWREISGRTEGPIVVRSDLSPCEPDRMAERLREDLRLAGVDRSDLFGGDEKIQPMRFHDLRATFTTWSKLAGKGDGWISDRTGHQTVAMLRRYARAARLLADLSYAPFPDLAGALDVADDNVVSLRR